MQIKVSQEPIDLYSSRRKYSLAYSATSVGPIR